MMFAGMGKAELTPPMGVELAGYGYYLNRRAAQVLDPLYARALYVKTDAEKWLLVSCEVLGLSRQIVDEVKRALYEKGLSDAQIMIVSIHTHTGPALKYHEGCGGVDPEFVKTVAGKIIRACLEAIGDARPVTALYGAFSPLMGDYAYNRACPEGPVDHMVRGFILKRGGARPIAAASFACHAVSRGRVSGVSADYPGALNALLEKRGYEPIYLNGLCGDIDPFVAPEQDRDERLNAFAAAIETAFFKNLTSLSLTLSAGRLSFTLLHEKVTREQIRSAADAAVARAGGETEAAAHVARIWEKEMLEKFDRLEFQEEISVSFTKLGDRLVLALPFEGFTQIGVHLRERLNAPETMVLGCAEELLGYLPTRDDIKRGAYAALESTFLYKRLPPLPGEAERLSDSLANELCPKEI